MKSTGTMSGIGFAAFVGFALTVLFVVAQSAAAQTADEIFKARVLEVQEQNEITAEDGTPIIQQKLKLKGLSGSWDDREFIFDGTKYEVVTTSVYKAGDTVMATRTQDTDGNELFYVTDYVRNGALWWIAVLFAVVVVAVGRLKGLRALVVLALTFIVILWFIVPRILAGNNPLFISIIGSVFILVLAIYITEGLKRTSTVAVVSICIALLITGLLSVWFTAITKLTGFASDEAIFLMGLEGTEINMRGLLLAGIIIGALGVLDDVIIAQVTLVKELKQANPELTKKAAYRNAMNVGVSHMSAMTNTLFLAYAGAALPLLLLFSVKQQPFLSIGQVVNNEMVATEIVRSLAGSIGLIIAVPIATLIAVNFIPAARSPRPDQSDEKIRQTIS